MMQKAVAFFICFLGLFFGLLLSSASAKEPIHLVRITSGSAAQEYFAHTLAARLARLGTVTTTVLPPFDTDTPTDAERDALRSQLPASGLVISIGSLASEALLSVRTTQRVLAIGVPQLKAQALLAEHPGAGVWILASEQPLSRQAKLFRLVFPDASGVGVLLGPTSSALLREVQTAFAKEGIVVHHETIQGREGILPALDRLLGPSHAVLSLADPVVFNAVTIRSILLSAYRVRRVLVAHADSYVDAGALYALFSSPDDLIDDSIAAIQRIERGETASGVLLPESFSIRINAHVARSLGLILPEAATLKKHLLNKG